MKKQIFTSLIFFILAISPNLILSQTLHVVEVSNFVFTPANLTVETGDTVRWINMEGLHNVVADDGSFTSGDPASNMWIFDHIFTAPGQNPYFCVVHGGPGGVGIAGVITVQMATDISESKVHPDKFELIQNYPYPFNPGTIISFIIPVTTFVNLKVYNILGNEIATLVNEEKAAGEYTLEFNASGLSSGIYFYTLSAGNYYVTKEMILLK